MANVRVLVVDDSALVRKILAEGLATDPEIEVVGVARDPYDARDQLVVKRPDVVVLDVEMPRMDGVTFLKHYMRVIPTPTVLVSALTTSGARVTIEALEAGAVDFLTKPHVGVADGLPRLVEEIVGKVKAAARATVRRPPRAASVAARSAASERHRAFDLTTDKVIALGCSTGGTQALARLLPQLPATTPGLAIVQHMPAGFTAPLAARLDSLSAIEVHEARDGDRLRPGLALLAPGGSDHMSVFRSGGQYRVRLRPGEKVHGHCPSVGVLFRSIAAEVGPNAIAGLLTGMGTDGAEELLMIRAAEGRTFVQDATSSVVWGMPGTAWELGAAELQLPLEEISGMLIEAVASARTHQER